MNKEQKQSGGKNIIKRIAKGIWWRIDPTESGKVRRLMKRPPAVREDTIVFSSSADFTGNPKALFLYMIDHGYNERYKITWFFENKDNVIDFGIPNVSSQVIWDDKGLRYYKAQKAIMEARWIFYSHNVNWARKYGKDQTFINLWHGCGYKGRNNSDKKKIYYDYLMVTGKKYIDITRHYLKDQDGVVLDLGYPRNEFLFSNRSGAREVLEELKRDAGAEKAVIWMPTFRKSRLARLDMDVELGETGLPVLYDGEMLAEFDEWCRRCGVLVILKQHQLAANYETGGQKYKNLLFINDSFLRNRDADLYELLGSSDALLTDYSSVAIDYLLCNKPLGYTLDDYDQYEAALGFSFDNVKDYMPGHHIYNMDDIKTFVKDIAEGKDPHAGWRESIIDEVHTYKDGFSERILNYFGIE